MNQKEKDNAAKVFKGIIDKCKNMRELARTLNEDASDVFHWREGNRKIRPDVVVKIARIYGIDPHWLRPDIFPSDCKLVFTKTKE